MGKSLPNSILNVLAQHVRIFDGNNDGPVNVARINGSFGLSVIDIGFSQLEAGDLFQVSEKFPNLSEGGNADLLIKVSSNVNVVCAFKVVGQARSELFLYEGTTVSTDGTELTPRSRNRQKASDASAAASFHSGPTVTDVGTELMASRGPGGAFGLFATGGESADIAQWVLKKGRELPVPPHERLQRRRGLQHLHRLLRDVRQIGLGPIFSFSFTTASARA